MAANDFYNENANRAFPFMRATTGVPAATGIGKLPDAAIVDAGFTMGLGSYFAADTNKVWLHSIVRSAGVFEFNFVSDAPGAYGVFITFSRLVSATSYQTEYVDNFTLPITTGSATSMEVYDVSASPACPDEPLWSGYLVTGNLTELAALLPANGSLVATGSQGTVEPSLVENLSAGFVSSVNLANQDRTRVTAADNCPDIAWPYPVGPGVLYVAGRCLIGDVRFKAGFNAIVRQESTTNSIFIGAAKGAGMGEPCTETPLFTGEVPPPGSTLLEGGFRCNEVVRGINGIGGQFASLRGGTGVQVTADPDHHKLIVDVNMNQLAVCYQDMIHISESVP